MTIAVIPKIIHQVSLSDKNCQYTLPGGCMPEEQSFTEKSRILEVSKVPGSWIKINYEWYYLLWSDDTIRTFLKKKYPEYLDFYLGLSDPEKINFAKYLIVEKYGGVFADMDSNCLQSIENLIKLYPKRKIFLSEIPPVTTTEKWCLSLLFGVSSSKKIVSDGILISVPNQEFWGSVAREIINRTKSRYRSIIPGKLAVLIRTTWNGGFPALTKTTHKNKVNINVLPHYHLDPCYESDERCKPISLSFVKQKRELPDPLHQILRVYFKFARNVIKVILSVCVLYLAYLMVKQKLS